MTSNFVFAATALAVGALCPAASAFAQSIDVIEMQYQQLCGRADASPMCPMLRMQLDQLRAAQQRESYNSAYGESDAYADDYDSGEAEREAWEAQTRANDAAALQMMQNTIQNMGRQSTYSPPAAPGAAPRQRCRSRELAPQGGQRSQSEGLPLCPH